MSDQTQAPAGEQAAPAPATAPEVSMADVDRLLQADEQAEYGAEEATEEPEATTPQAEPEKPAEEPPGEPEGHEQPRGDLRVALREERERRRQAEQVAAAIAQRERAVAQYLANLQGPKAPDAPPVPDFEADPAGNLKHGLENVKQTLTQLMEQQRQVAEYNQRQAALAQAEQAVVGNEQAFAKQNADYYDAVDFVRGRTRAKFEALGVPKEQIDAAVAHDMRQFALSSLQAGRNPAEQLYRLAKIDGYKLSSAPDEAAQKLASVVKGAAASRGARSSAPASNGELTMNDAVKLSYKELAKMNDDAWARLMGGA